MFVTSIPVTKWDNTITMLGSRLKLPRFAFCSNTPSSGNWLVEKCPWFIILSDQSASRYLAYTPDTKFDLLQIQT